jgi:hypothetical protein
MNLACGASASSLIGQVASRGLALGRAPKISAHPFGSKLTDIALQAGLHLPTIYGGVEHKEYILEADGCGCAFFDYDNDGWIDIFVLSGTRFGDASIHSSNRLYRNNRDSTFTDVTEAAGLSAEGWAMGVCIGDYNNDGFEDIFCTYFGQNRLYRNNGNGTFTDVTEAAGLAGPPGSPAWSTGCSFVEINRNGYLDLFVATYIDYDLKSVPRPENDVNCNWKGIPVNCGPRGLKPSMPGEHVLYRNNGDGTFTDITKQAGIAGPKRAYGLTVVAADFDEDGWQDIYVACDSTPSLLYINNHDGTFREEAYLRGVAFSDDGEEQAGMGLAIGDANNDGHLDIFKTNFTDDSSDLYINDGHGRFTDRTRLSGIGQESRFTSWGAGIVDLDNDGNPDIFLVTGSVYPEVAPKLPRYPDRSPRLLFRNLGNGTFEELGAQAGDAISVPHSSRGCAFGDFDNDGDIDILVINMNEPPSLLRNDVTKLNHWLKVKLIGTRSNRSAIGARVVVSCGGKRCVQSVASQSSYLSSNDPRLHFGLGKNRVADIEIYWPSGTKERVASAMVDQLITVREGEGIIAKTHFNHV